jgi:hypothetical protein
MDVRNLVRSRLGTVAVGATIIAVLGAGGAVAAGQITGADIKRNSVPGSDLKDSSVGYGKLTDNAKSKLQGQQGPAGPQGEQGPAGPAGQSLVANETTGPNATYGGVQVVDVDSVAATSGGPSTTEGSELVDPIELEQGTYLVQSTVQFFDFQPSATNDVDYGVARLFMDGTTVGTSWSPQVPDDGNNAAQAAGSIVITVPAGGGTLTARAVLRGGDDGQAGGNLIVTRIEAPAATP